MLPDSLQALLHAQAAHHALLGRLAVFCATTLLYLLVAALAALGLTRRPQLTWGLAARVTLSLAVAAGLTLLLGGLVPDPRPYLTGHYRPLTHVAADNGFPSDHALIAALLTGWAGWLARRAAPLFALGLLLVMLGRLAIGAHHSLDVLGSVVFAGTGLAAAARLRLPAGWQTRPLLPAASAGQS